MNTRTRLLLLVATVAFASKVECRATGYAGIYFGTFEDTRGEWAMVADGVNLPTFFAYLPDHADVFQNYPYGGDFYPDGRIEDNAFDYTLNGKIAAGSVEGIFTRPALPTSGAYSVRFSGIRDTASGGPVRPITGAIVLKGIAVSTNYTVPVVNGRVIVGPSGRFLINAWSYAGEEGTNLSTWPRTWQAGASGQLGVGGKGMFASPDGRFHGELSVNGNGHVAARITDPVSGALIEISGNTPVNRLINLSTRGYVGVGEDVLISGFTIAGTGNKRVLIRAIGPTLKSYGISSPLPDPNVSLIRMSDHTLIASEDHWYDGREAELLDAMGRVGAFPVSPSNSEAMILVDLPPGGYSAIASGVGNTTGVGLVEVYAVDDNRSIGARLVNISTRALVGTGERVLIPGFVPSGNAGAWVLVRAVGPGLANLGVANPLHDPVMSVLTFGSNVQVAANDDWDSLHQADTMEGVFERVGAFPLVRGSRDAALVFYANANQPYTVVLSGKDGSTGVALAEIYELDASPW